MKKIIFIFALIIGITTMAQGRINNQSGIHLQYGLMPSKKENKLENGLMTSEKENKATSFIVNAGYLKVFNEQGWLGKAEASYAKYDVAYFNNQKLPYERYSVNIQAGWTYEGLNPVYFNVFSGIFAGFEKINNGEEKDPLENIKIPYKVKGFTYGISGTAEVEVAILPTTLSFIANYTQFLDLKSKFSKESYGIFGGLRFYII